MSHAETHLHRARTFWPQMWRLRIQKATQGNKQTIKKRVVSVVGSSGVQRTCRHRLLWPALHLKTMGCNLTYSTVLVLTLGFVQLHDSEDREEEEAPAAVLSGRAPVSMRASSCSETKEKRDRKEVGLQSDWLTAWKLPLQTDMGNLTKRLNSETPSWRSGAHCPETCWNEVITQK